MLETPRGQSIVRKFAAAIMIGLGCLLVLWGLSQFFQKQGSGVFVIILGLFLAVIGYFLYKQA